MHRFDLAPPNAQDSSRDRLLAETLRSHFNALLEDLYDSVEPAYAPLARLGKTNKEIFAALRDARNHFDPSDDEPEEEAR